MKIFDPDGALMGALGKLSDLIFLNFTFVLFCLPLFTIGASIAALYDCTTKLIEDKEDVFIPRQFWRSFKQHFKRGTACWLLTWPVILFLAAYSYVIRFFDGTLAKTYQITFWILVIVFLLGYQYILPLIALTDKKVGETWRTAWKLAIVAFPWSLLNIAVLIGLSGLLIVLLPANTCIYLWAFLFFAMIVYLSSFVIRIVFNKYIYPKEEEVTPDELWTLGE